ncbi:MAG: helix-turn-helix transcriptional regulator [Clostridia bacterium]|nr:helix-turn-helix transcriptional regulator [Clostridia bacterium]
MCYYLTMITMPEIQKRLRDAIKYSNITQKELADRLGINPSTVSKYMRLDKFPSLDTFANICRILDVSADDILGVND